jgi:DNA relaxase NicK
VFISIDWLSFTIEMEVSQLAMSFSIWERVGQKLGEQFPLAKRAFVDGYEWSPRAGRAPYNAATQRADSGVMAFAHQRISNALFEVGGIGLDALGSIEAELAVASEVQSRLTRIDIAVDIFTETRPDEFAKVRGNEKFKAWSEAVSETGHTIYIGSKTSDRYARV